MMTMMSLRATTISLNIFTWVIEIVQNFNMLFVCLLDLECRLFVLHMEIFVHISPCEVICDDATAISFDMMTMMSLRATTISLNMFTGLIFFFQIIVASVVLQNDPAYLLPTNKHDDNFFQILLHDLF